MPATTFTIIHFNDVYNVTEGENEPVGGISRFVSAVRSFKDRNPLILFSGDALNPSFLSQTTKGQHMITALNEVGVHCAVYGNHDFDFGVDTLLERAAESNFPWLLSNCTDNATCEPLANGKIFEIMEWGGLRIGLIGLIEEEWVATLAAVDADLITVTDFIAEGNELGRMLKTEKNCDLVIALTHSRWPNDDKLARECDPDLIDLILGGHDHDYNVHTFERRTADGRFRKLTALKSGADFRDFSILTVQVEEVEVEARFFGKLSATSSSELELDSQTCIAPRKFISDLQVERIQVTRQFPQEPVSAASVRKFVEQREADLNVVLGEVDVDLDARFSEVRTRETNVGNFICDVMLKAVEAHAALLNGGDLRADCIFQKGEFRVKHLEMLLPTPDPIVVLCLTGRQLLQALENGVSQVPKMEGRFPQIGGIRFGYDPDRPSGSRIDPSWVTVQDERLDLDREYKVCTTEYLSLGKDGYDVFKSAPRIGTADDGPRLPNIMRNHFHSCNVLEGKTRPRSVHRQCTLSLVQKRTIECQLDDDGVETFNPLGNVQLIGMEEEQLNKAEPKSPSSAWKTHLSPVRKHLRSLYALSRTRSIVRQKSVEDIERQARNGRIAPVVDGRTYIVHSEEPSRDPSPPAELSEPAGPRKTGIPKQRSLVKQQQVDE